MSLRYAANAISGAISMPSNAMFFQDAAWYAGAATPEGEAVGLVVEEAVRLAVPAVAEEAELVPAALLLDITPLVIDDAVEPDAEAEEVADALEEAEAEAEEDEFLLCS